MIDLLSMFSTIFLAADIIKEKSMPTIPKSYWENQKLMYKDKIENRCTHDQFMKSLKDGKYKVNHPVKEGRIDNKTLYWKDLNSHSYSHEQLQQFIESGRYNLSDIDKQKHDKQMEHDKYKDLNSRYIAINNQYVLVYTDRAGELRYYNNDKKVALF